MGMYKVVTTDADIDRALLRAAKLRDVACPDYRAFPSLLSN
jgi:hypothetical protein